MIFEKIISRLPKRVRGFCRKHEDKLTYIFFGGLTTLVSILTQYAADYLGANTLAATTVSWVCAVTFAFFVNKIFVFKNASDDLHDFFRQAGVFYCARLTTYFSELGFMILTVDILLLNMHVMKITAQVFILIGNYLLSKYVIFKKKE